jgi:transcriptional regulator with XRE-family HTH domain
MLIAAAARAALQRCRQAMDQLRCPSGREAPFVSVRARGAAVPGKGKCTLPKAGGARGLDVQIGRRLKLRRLQLKITTAEVAQLVGLSEQDYIACEQGTRRVGAELLVRIAELMEVPLTWFYEDAEAHGEDDGSHSDGDSAIAQGDVAALGTEERVEMLLAHFRELEPAAQAQVIELARQLSKTSD